MIDFFRLIGSEWMKLTYDEKQVYEEKAKRDRERYLEEIQCIPPGTLFSLP